MPDVTTTPVTESIDVAARLFAATSVVSRARLLATAAADLIGDAAAAVYLLSPEADTVAWRIAASTSHLYSLLCILFAPILRDHEDAYFVGEPLRSAKLHASAAGVVDTIAVHEGEQVHSGETLLTLRSNSTESLRSRAEAQTIAARFDAYNSQVSRHTSMPSAARETAFRSEKIAEEAQSSLTVRTPIDGIVLTESLEALAGRNIGSGEELLAIADGSGRIARLFVPSAALDRIVPNAEVSLDLPEQFSKLRLQLPRYVARLATLNHGDDSGITSAQKLSSAATTQTVGRIGSTRGGEARDEETISWAMTDIGAKAQPLHEIVHDSLPLSRNSAHSPPTNSNRHGPARRIVPAHGDLPTVASYRPNATSFQFSSRRNCVSFVSASIVTNSIPAISTKSWICSVVSDWLNPVWCAPPA